jgi:hypothetical protein
MNTRQQLFFATKNDIIEILVEFEKKVNIKYIKSGLFEINKIEELNSLTEFIPLGVINFGDWALSETFLIYKKGTQINSREILQNSGEKKYLIDQIKNPETIVLRPGGLYGNCVIAGYIGTISSNKSSIELYSLLLSHMKKQFKKIGVCYVGKESVRLMDSGWRLTQFANGAKEYDLKK